MSYFAELLPLLLNLVLVVLIAIVGYRFYKLAKPTGRNPWLQAVLGAFAYYGIASVTAGVLVLVAWHLLFDDTNSRYDLLAYLIIPVLRLASYVLVYRYMYRLREWYLGIEASTRSTVARQLLCFTGRSGRQEFFMKGLLPLIGINLVLGVMTLFPEYGFSRIVIVLSVLSLWPVCAIYIKRLRDRDRSPWWLLFALIPVAGAIWLIVEAWFMKGTAGPNRYGPDPLAQASSQGKSPAEV